MDNLSLRKAAIFIRSLDPEAAAVMLTELSSGEAKKLRQAIRELGELEHEDRVDVFDEFQTLNQESEVEEKEKLKIANEASLLSEETSSSQELVKEKKTNGETTETYHSPSTYMPQTYNLIKDEVDFSSLATQTASVSDLTQVEESESVTASSTETKIFDFLEDSKTETIVEYLKQEHPQTIAVVLSQIDPQRSAKILAALSTETQPEVLERLYHLQTSDFEVVEVVAQELQLWLTNHQLEQVRQQDRIEKIQAILAASDSEQREVLFTRLERNKVPFITKVTSALEKNETTSDIVTPPENNPDLKETSQKNVHSEEHTASDFSYPTTTPYEPVSYAASITTDSFREDEPLQYYSQYDEIPVLSPSVMSYENATFSPCVTTSETTVSTLEATMLDFNELVYWPKKELVDFLTALDRKTFITAMLGANEPLQNHIYGALGWFERRRLRNEINNFGPLQLSDIDTAQLEVAYQTHRFKAYR